MLEKADFRTFRPAPGLGYLRDVMSIQCKGEILPILTYLRYFAIVAQHSLVIHIVSCSREMCCFHNKKYSILNG